MYPVAALTAKRMESSIQEITIEVTCVSDEKRDEYDAFTKVLAEVILDEKQIGHIFAILVDRKKIPENCFLSACDKYSRDLQSVALKLYEPRYGRTKLQSLAEYDDKEFQFMFITSFHIDNAYKINGDSNVGAAALQQFLFHPIIKGNEPHGLWKVSSAVYCLDPLEAMTADERDSRASRPLTQDDPQAIQKHQARMDSLARADANQFLRNGFFQDPAVARQGHARFLVASYGHWNQPLGSHAQVAEATLVTPPIQPPPPFKLDKEILIVTEIICNESKKFYSVSLSPRSVTRMGVDTRTVPDWEAFHTDLERLISQGGSIANSHALHEACSKNCLEVVDCLLKLDPSALDALNSKHQTPLMVAALNAAGRTSMHGILETRVIDFLLAAGASTDLTDEDGLTAYGHFRKAHDDYVFAIQEMNDQPRMVRPRPPAPGVAALEMRLMPLQGPTTSDLSGNEKAPCEDGLVDYSRLDRELDEMLAPDDEEEEEEAKEDKYFQNVQQLSFCFRRDAAYDKILDPDDE